MATTRTNPPRPIPGAVRARINQQAHAMAIQFETRLRGELMQRVQEAVNTGASIEKMWALVDPES